MKKIINILLLLMLVSNAITGQNFFERHGYSLEILPLLNTDESEISPAFIKGELWFTAIREQHTTNRRSWLRDDKFYDVFQTQTDVAGYPQILGKLINGFGHPYHEGPVSWCETTGELFVTQSNVAAGAASGNRAARHDVKLKIVVMKEVDDKWVISEELPFNSMEFDYTHPAISSTGDTLVFSSDRKGGYGKSDLYMSVRSEGEWSEPQNLGQRVNTSGNEYFPGFGPDGLLVFSSDGHTKNLGQLDLYSINLTDDVSVLHLGDQINSEYDDFGLVIHSSREYGYFSSNRPGAGSDDIYRVQLVSLYEHIGGVVVDAKGIPVPDVTVDLQDCNGNQLQSTASNVNGRFSFEVYKDSCHQALATKKGYNPDLKYYYLEKSVKLNIVQIIDYRVLPLDAETNKPVREAIVHCLDNQWISDDEGFIKVNADSATMCDLRITADNYFDYVIESHKYQFNPGDEIVEQIRIFKKEINKIFHLRNIHFFLDRWRLLPESEQELRKLIKLMNDNPTLKVEVASHTDSRGEAQYNLWLSQKRSDSAADFLIENGIARERIVSQGYGESRLINHCDNGVNCSEKEHLENRRTDFTILDY